MIAAPAALLAVLYAGGYLAQFIGNYAVWKQGGGIPGDGTAPLAVSPGFVDCLSAAVRPPYGIYGIFICIGLLAVLLIMVMRMGYSDAGEYDEDRNFTYSAKGTYGTSGWMSRREMGGVLDLVSDLRRHHGIVLGQLEGKAVCLPEKSRLNSNLAVYGASGSMKTRAFCMNRILQGVSRGESLIICDPKSELYEKSSGYLRDRGYVVRVFNLVCPENSDSWNCLSEIEGQELMAQLFVDVIIKNTMIGSKGDHFWDSAEMNLLKALVLYVDQGYPPENRNMGQVYQLLTLSSENALDSLFGVLPAHHPAKAPYSLFKQASDSVRGGVVIGLGSRLQVFQADLIKKITARDEIDLELPGQERCAYFLVTSDQDSTFDFLASLFLSFAFIKLVRFADKNCEGGVLPVPVHVLGEELTACGTIPDLSRRLSVIRSRNISMSCVFQNLAGLQNRYPQNLWQEILGNCDVQLFLGCTDPLTAEFVSSRTGLASVAVTSKAKQLGTWRISNYTPEYRETSGVGKRPVLTPDEVLRLPIDEALIIIRGKKILKVDKLDYSKHPDYPLLHSCKASAYIPEWRRLEMEAAADSKNADKRKSSAEELKTEGIKAKEPKVERTKAKEPKAGGSKAKEPKAKAATAEASKTGAPKETDSRTKTPESGQKKGEKKSSAPKAGGQAGIVVTDKESIMS
ncbi:MAG: type IV secretory system conjugative DNA transfer family protein [Acetatifactor sp.]|nr:type IV secretory system conjugative DNA transfer family protein [Acetatifactor sp.]